MKKVELITGALYRASINRMSFGPLHKKQLIKLYSDGRIGGRMVEPIVAEIFLDYRCDIGGNNKYDIIRESTDGKNEVKTYTKSSGCKLIPSSQIGTGRKYNREAFIKRANSIEKYFIVDIRDFPNIAIIAHDSKDIIKRYPDGINIPDSIFESEKIIDLGYI